MSNSTKRKRRLGDAYRFKGFRPQADVRGIFGDAKARIMRLVRRSKKRFVVAVDAFSQAGTTGAGGVFAISPVAICGSTWRSKYGACSAAVVGW